MKRFKQERVMVVFTYAGKGKLLSGFYTFYPQKKQKGFLRPRSTYANQLKLCTLHKSLKLVETNQSFKEIIGHLVNLHGKMLIILCFFN